jgi:hypothetical protein
MKKVFVGFSSASLAAMAAVARAAPDCCSGLECCVQMLACCF